MNWRFSKNDWDSVENYMAQGATKEEAIRTQDDFLDELEMEYKQNMREEL